MSSSITRYSSRAPRASLPKLTDRIPIGEAELSLSPICLGWVNDPDTIPAAFDAGINFFFVTCDLHWPIYEATRRGLHALLRRGHGIRDRIVVAAVSYVTQNDFAYAPFRELLEAIPRLGHLDVLVIGGAYEQDFRARRLVYRRYVERGEFGARAIAATFHDRAAALTAINHAEVDLAFIRYSPAYPGALADLFPDLRPSRTRLFNFKSTVGYRKPRELRALGVSDQLWYPRATDYYRFVLSTPEVDGILCALRRPREVTALGRALAAPPLDQDEQRYLIDLAALSAGRARHV